MTPLIKSGQEHVLSPINLSDVEVGDIVFCKVKGRYYTHLVKAKGDRGVLIGNNHGKINGTPVELPVYHVRDARDYIRWWLDGKQGRLPGTREVVKVDTYQQLFRPGTHAYEQAVKFDNNWVYLPIPCSKGGYIGETSKHFMHLETEQIPNPRYAEIQSSLDALTKSVEDLEAGITVTFSDGVTPVPMEYLTNEINNAHYRLSITSRYVTVNHGYGQLYPLVKRIDYERTIQEMARETSM